MKTFLVAVSAAAFAAALPAAPEVDVSDVTSKLIEGGITVKDVTELPQEAQDILNESKTDGEEISPMAIMVADGCFTNCPQAQAVQCLQDAIQNQDTRRNKMQDKIQDGPDMDQETKQNKMIERISEMQSSGKCPADSKRGDIQAIIEELGIEIDPAQIPEEAKEIIEQEGDGNMNPMIAIAATKCFGPGCSAQRDCLVGAINDMPDQEARGDDLDIDQFRNNLEQIWNSDDCPTFATA